MARYSRSSPRPNEGERGDAARAAPYLEDEHNDFGEYDDAEVRLCSYYGPCHDYTERFVRNSPNLFTRGSYYPSPHVTDDGRESDNWSDENEQDEIWAHRYGTHEPYPQNGEEFRNSTMNPYDFVRGVGSPDELARSRPDSPPHYGCWADLESEEGIREGNSGTLTSITFSKASEYRYGMYEPYLSVTDPDTSQNDITDERSASLSEYRCGMYEPYLSSVTDLVTLQSEITEQRSANPSAYADHEPFGYEKGEKPKDEDLQPDLSISGKRRDEKRFQPLPSTSGNAYRNNLLTEGERYGKNSLFGLGILHSPADSIDYEPPLIKQVHEDGCSEDSDDALSVCCETCGHISHCGTKSDNQSMSDSNLSSDFFGHGYEADDSSDEEECDTIWPFGQSWSSHNRREMDTAHKIDESKSDASYHPTLVKEIIDDSSMIISGKQRNETGFQHLSPAASNVYRNIFLCGEEQNGRNSDTLFGRVHSTRPKDCFEDNPLHITRELKGDKQESRIDTCRTKAATLRLLLKKSEEETVSMPFKEKEEEKEADKVGDGGQETLQYSFQDSRQYTNVCMEDSDDALSVCSHHGPCYDIHHITEYMSMCDVHSTVFSGFLDDEHEGGHSSDEEDNSNVWPFCYTTASQNRREMDTAYTMDESCSDASCHNSWASHNRREMDTALTMNESYSDASCHNSWASHNRREMDTALTMNESYSDASCHNSWAFHNRREMDTALTMNESYSDASCHNSWASHNRREMDTAHTMDESYSDASCHNSWASHNRREMDTALTMNESYSDASCHNSWASHNRREMDTALTMNESYSDASCHNSWASHNRREMDTAHTMDESYSDASCHNSWASHNRREMDTALTMNESYSDASCHNSWASHNRREMDTALTMNESYSDASCHNSWASHNRREMDTAHTMDESYSDASCHNSWASHNRREMDTALTMNESYSDASCHNSWASHNRREMDTALTMNESYSDASCHNSWASHNRREMDTAHTMDESHSDASCHNSWASHNGREMDTALTMNEANSDASYHATLVKEIIDDSSARLSARVVPQPLPNENRVKQTDLQPDPFISGEEIAETAFQHLPTTSGNVYRNNFLFSEEQHGGNSDTLYEGGFSLRSKDFFERNSSYIPTESNDDTEEPNTGTYQTLDEKDDIPVSDDEEADDFRSPMISGCHQKEAEGNAPKSRETEESTFGNRYQEVLATRPSAVLGDEGATGHRTIADGRDGHKFNEGIIDGSRNKSSNRTFTRAIQSETGVDIVSTKDEYHSDASEKLPSRDTTVSGEKPASTSSEMISGTFQRIARGLKRDPEHLQPDVSTHTDPGVKTNLHASHTTSNDDRIRRFGIEEQHRRNWDTLCEQGLWHNTNDCFEYSSLGIPTESNGDGDETNIASHQARAKAFRRQEKMAQEDTVQMLAEGDEDMSLWSFTNDKESADYERCCLDCDSMPRGEDLNNHRTQSPKKSNRSTTNKEHHFVGAKFDDNHERASKVIIKNSSKCEASNVDIHQRDEVTTLRLSLGNMLIKQKARKQLDLNKLFLCIYGCSIPEDEEKDKHSQSCQSEGEYDSEDEDEYLLLHQKKDKTSAKTGSPRSTCLHQERDSFVHRQEREEISFASDDLESNYTLPSADQCHRVAEPGIYMQDNNENLGQGQQATHEPADVTENPGNVSVGDFRIGHNRYTGKSKQHAVLLKVPDKNHTCTNERNGDESCQDKRDTFDSLRLKQALSEILHHVHQIEKVEELASASRITAGIRDASLVPDLSHDTDRDDRTFSAQQISDDINEAQNGCDQTFLCGDALLEAQPGSLRTNGLLATNVTENKPSASYENQEDGVVGLTCADEYSAGHNQEATGTSFLSSLQQLEHGFIACAENNVDIDAQTDGFYPNYHHEHTVLRNNPTKTQAKREDAYKKGLISTDNIGDHEFQSTRRNLDSDICNAELDQHKGEDDGTTEQGQFCMHDEVVPIGHTGSMSETDIESTCKHAQTANHVSSDAQRQEQWENHPNPGHDAHVKTIPVAGVTLTTKHKPTFLPWPGSPDPAYDDEIREGPQNIDREPLPPPQAQQPQRIARREVGTPSAVIRDDLVDRRVRGERQLSHRNIASASPEPQGIARGDGETPIAFIHDDLVEQGTCGTRRLSHRRISSASLQPPDTQGIAGREGETPSTIICHDLVEHRVRDERRLPHLRIPSALLPQPEPQGIAGRVAEPGRVVIEHGARGERRLPHLRIPSALLQQLEPQGIAGRMAEPGRVIIEHGARGERPLPYRRIPYTAHLCCCPQCLLVHLRTTIGLSAVSVPFPELCQEDDESYGNSGRGGR